MVCVNRLEMLKYAIRENGGGGGGTLPHFLWLMYVLFLLHALVIPEKLVELIRRDQKSAALCPFP